MRIYCPSLKNDLTLPERYTCKGENISPPLIFEEIPTRTKSMYLILEDVSAPGRAWVHWLLFNIPKETFQAEEGKVPSGAVEGLANNNTFGYEGPCPKYFKGIHHYFFRLVALDKTLSLARESDSRAVIEASKNHVIDEAVLEVTEMGEFS